VCQYNYSFNDRDKIEEVPEELNDRTNNTDSANRLQDEPPESSHHDSNNGKFLKVSF
jgi:hypothetical protein